MFSRSKLLYGQLASNARLSRYSSVPEHPRHQAFHQLRCAFLSRKHRLPRAPAIALLQDAMARPGLPLVHFNDTCCGSAAELRSIILKARRLADDHAEQDRAAAAAKSWLLAQIGKKRIAPSGIADTAPEPFAPNASPPSDRPQQPATV